MLERQQKRSESSPESSLVETFKKIFSRFLELSDEPGEFLSITQKLELSKKSMSDPEALKKWKEETHSKYRINSLWSPLAAAETILTDSAESEKIPKEEKEELLKRVKNSLVDLDKSRGSKISKELVDEVMNIVKEIEQYIK